MANWSLPTLTSTYTNYTSEVKALASDLALACDPAFVTQTNALTNTVRWNSATSRWQKYNGTTWGDLATTYQINVSTAVAWQTGRTIQITGDVAGTSTAFTGAANLSFAVTLPTVNSNVGAFGSASAVPVITVNAKGQVTAVSTAALGTMANQNAASVNITGGSISGTAITLVQSTSAAPTAEGVVQWDTDDDTLKIGTGVGTRTVANTDGAQTLTSKTMSTGCVWSGNTIAVANGGTGGTTQATAQTALDVPSRTGSNASGTWGIAISGNAATATSAATLTTARTINGVSFNGSSNITVTASTTNTVTFDNGGTGAASGTAFNGSTAYTISYNTIGAPSASGAGASGTWGIDISGTAAAANTVASGGTTVTYGWGTANTTIATTAFVDRLRSLAAATITTGTLTLADRGTLVQTTGSITAPSGVFGAGDVVSIFNNQGVASSLIQGSGLTLMLGGTSTTGTRTLAIRAMVTLTYLSSTVAIVTGAGVS